MNTGYPRQNRADLEIDFCRLNLKKKQRYEFVEIERLNIEEYSSEWQSSPLPE